MCFRACDGWLSIAAAVVHSGATLALHVDVLACIFQPGDMLSGEASEEPPALWEPQIPLGCRRKIPGPSLSDGPDVESW